MKLSVQNLIDLFNNLNDEEKIILHNHINSIVYKIKQNNIKKELVIDYEQIMSLSWF